MKYIRTKDGIFEVVDENDRYYKCINPQTSWATIKSKIENDENGIDYALAEADTIEELCDEFVGLVKSTSSDFIIMRVMAHSLKELKESLKTKLNGEVYQGHYDIVYGAVWTSKGLIYVAKMNEKGELELI